MTCNILQDRNVEGTLLKGLEIKCLRGKYSFTTGWQVLFNHRCFSHLTMKTKPKGKNLLEMPSVPQHAAAAPTILQAITFLQSSLQQFQRQVREIYLKNITTGFLHDQLPTTTTTQLSVFMDIMLLIWKWGRGLEWRTGTGFRALCPQLFLCHYTC